MNDDVRASAAPLDGTLACRWRSNQLMLMISAKARPLSAVVTVLGRGRPICPPTSAQDEARSIPTPRTMIAPTICTNEPSCLAGLIPPDRLGKVRSHKSSSNPEQGCQNKPFRHVFVARMQESRDQRWHKSNYDGPKNTHYALLLARQASKINAGETKCASLIEHRLSLSWGSAVCCDHTQTRFHGSLLKN